MRTDRRSSRVDLPFSVEGQIPLVALSSCEDNIWCASPVKFEGKYYLFHSRWPRHLGFDAWVTDSRIGVAMAESPEGPYTFVDSLDSLFEVSLAHPLMMHNPHVLFSGDRLFLYFTYVDFNPERPGHWKPSMDDSLWWEFRNRQQIGLASAARPEGPWRLERLPLIGNEPGVRISNTPCVSIRPDGQFFLVHKTVAEAPGEQGGAVRHQFTVARNPLGPFIKVPGVFLEESRTKFPLDDHLEWYQNGRFWALLKDHGEGIVKNPPVLFWMHSLDGFVWECPDEPLFLPFRMDLGNNKICHYDRLEMPKLLFDGKRPTHLFLAAKAAGSEFSSSLVLALQESLVLVRFRDSIVFMRSVL